MTGNAYSLTIVLASMATVFVAVSGLLVAIFKRGRSEGVNEGRLTQILANLQTIITDHEARLRVLESHRTPGP